METKVRSESAPNNCRSDKVSKEYADGGLLFTGCHLGLRVQEDSRALDDTFFYYPLKWTESVSTGSAAPQKKNAEEIEEDPGALLSSGTT